MRENCDLVIPVNILTYFARAPFSWAARHTTVCLDKTDIYGLECRHGYSFRANEALSKDLIVLLE